MGFVEINGGHGDGGGQIVRSAITLSCITKKPVHVVNIRKNRKVAGLRPQHVAAIRILQKISSAKVTGNKTGSTELRFIPKEINIRTLNEDVGTAGSVSLVMQTIIPLAIVLKEKLKVRIRGGTDVLWSPTSSYSEIILREAFGRMGLKFSLETVKRGYFPRGGGETRLEVFPSKVGPVLFSGRTSGEVTILCTFSKIAAEQISREVKKIERKIRENFSVNVKIKEEKAADSGSSILVYSIDEKTVFGMDCLFDKRDNSFDFDVEEFLGNPYAIDENLADMLVLPASLASGKTTFEVKEITPHLETNLFVTSKITGCRYGIGRLPTGYRVIVEGTSSSSSYSGIK